MRLVIILILLFQLKSDSTWGQSNRSFNLIVTIDDNVVTNLDRFKLILQTGKEVDTLNAEYIPGRLQLKKEIEMQKNKSDLNKIVLVFFYDDYRRSTHKQYSYRISLSNEAVQRDFNIVQIFNLDDKVNRKRFIDNQKEYVYDYIYPGGGSLAARR